MYLSFSSFLHPYIPPLCLSASIWLCLSVCLSLSLSLYIYIYITHLACHWFYSHLYFPHSLPPPCYLYSCCFFSSFKAQRSINHRDVFFLTSYVKVCMTVGWCREVGTRITKMKTGSRDLQKYWDLAKSPVNRKLFCKEIPWISAKIPNSNQLYTTVTHTHTNTHIITNAH